METRYQRYQVAIVHPRIGVLSMTVELRDFLTKDHIGVFYERVCECSADLCEMLGDQREVTLCWPDDFVEDGTG